MSKLKQFLLILNLLRKIKKSEDLDYEQIVWVKWDFGIIAVGCCAFKCCCRTWVSGLENTKTQASHHYTLDFQAIQANDSKNMQYYRNVK